MNSTNNDTSSNLPEHITLNYWCFMCETEFPHPYTGPTDVFCPQCNGIAAQIDPEDDPRNFTVYDAQRETPNTNPSQPTNSQSNQAPNNTNLPQQNPPQAFNFQFPGFNGQSNMTTQITIQSFGPQGMTSMQTFGPNGQSNVQNVQQPQFQQTNVTNNMNILGNPFGFVNNMLSGLFGGQGVGNMGFGNLLQDLDNAIIEQFLRNDPNRYGAAPAEQESINKLKEIEFSKETCKTKECSICQEDYNEGEILSDLPCAHNFHKKCVTQWLTLHNSCPVCRKSLEESAAKAAAATATENNSQGQTESNN